MSEGRGVKIESYGEIRRFFVVYDFQKKFHKPENSVCGDSRFRGKYGSGVISPVEQAVSVDQYQFIHKNFLMKKSLISALSKEEKNKKNSKKNR